MRVGCSCSVIPQAGGVVPVCVISPASQQGSKPVGMVQQHRLRPLLCHCLQQHAFVSVSAIGCGAVLDKLLRTLNLCSSYLKRCCGTAIAVKDYKVRHSEKWTCSTVQTNRQLQDIMIITHGVQDHVDVLKYCYCGKCRTEKRSYVVTCCQTCEWCQ